MEVGAGDRCLTPSNSQRQSRPTSRLTARNRATILAAIDRQLLGEPLTETRNRKPLRPNPIAPWELRVGELRVFYDVAQRPEGGGVVRILAVGRKQRNVLTIGGKEISL